MNQDHTIAASFAIDTFTITPSSGTWGINLTITPDGTSKTTLPQTVQGLMDTPTLQLLPSQKILGYHIADVLVDGSSVVAVAKLHIPRSDCRSYDCSIVCREHSRINILLITLMPDSPVGQHQEMSVVKRALYLNDTELPVCGRNHRINERRQCSSVRSYSEYWCLSLPWLQVH